MSETQRFDLTVIQKIYADAVQLQQEYASQMFKAIHTNSMPRRENGHFHLGKYCDDCSKQINTGKERERERFVLAFSLLSL